MKKLLLLLLPMLALLLGCSKSDSNPGNIIEEPTEKQAKDYIIVHSETLESKDMGNGMYELIYKADIENQSDRDIKIQGDIKQIELSNGTVHNNVKLSTMIEAAAKKRAIYEKSLTTDKLKAPVSGTMVGASETFDYYFKGEEPDEEENFDGIKMLPVEIKNYHDKAETIYDYFKIIYDNQDRIIEMTVTKTRSSIGDLGFIKYVRENTEKGYLYKTYTKEREYDDWYPPIETIILEGTGNFRTMALYKSGNISNLPKYKWDVFLKIIN